MNLTFKTEFPWGKPTNFRQQIQEDKKVHTFRLGDRWKPGDRIHFWEGNPRHYTNALRFNPNFNGKTKFWEEYPNEWPADKQETDTKQSKYYPTQIEALPVVSSIERFKIIFANEGWERFFLLIEGVLFAQAKVTGTYKGTAWSFINEEGILLKIAENDGFDDPAGFVAWFYRAAREKGKRVLDGQIIRWAGEPYTHRAEII
jgi:hypothetical protein